jgi:hypothetical protein
MKLLIMQFPPISRHFISLFGSNNGMRISNVICLDDNGILSTPRTVKNTKNSYFEREKRYFFLINFIRITELLSGIESGSQDTFVYP